MRPSLMGKKSPVALFAELSLSASPWARKKRGFCARVPLACATSVCRLRAPWVMVADGHLESASPNVCTGAVSHEAHLSTQQGTPQAHAWVPCTHGHEERSKGIGPAPLQGPPQADTLIKNVGVCLTHARLLRPPQLGCFRRSLPLQAARYARETITEISSNWVTLATATIHQTDSTSMGSAVP